MKKKNQKKYWFLSTLFGIILMIPITLTVSTLHKAGVPIGVTILLIGISVPSLLIPTLPKKKRQNIMKAGWPARVAFGVPGMAMGSLMIQITILKFDKIPFINNITFLLFGNLMLFTGLFLLVQTFHDPNDQ